MAVTWDVDIRVTDMAENRVRVTYRRTDDVAGTNWSHTIKGIIDTAKLAVTRKAITDKVWAEWLSYSGKLAAAQAKTDSWEPVLAADIQAKEVI